MWTYIDVQTIVWGKKEKVNNRMEYGTKDAPGKTLRQVPDIVKDNKSTLDNSPPPNYDKESKDECHHVNNNPRYKWYVK